MKAVPLTGMVARKATALFRVEVAASRAAYFASIGDAAQASGYQIKERAARERLAGYEASDG